MGMRFRIALGAALLVIAAFVIFDESEEERAARVAQGAREHAEKEAKRVEDRRRGFHCLSVWDGSHSELKLAVRRQVRDPDSFEHIETLIWPVRNDGTHRLRMNFRARNGFGGMSLGTVLAEVRQEDCAYKVLESFSR